MMIIGCDFHSQLATSLLAGHGDGRKRRAEAGTGQWRCGTILPASGGAGADRDGSHGELSQIGHELWVGVAAQIRASYVRQQKTDKRDAVHILKLLVEGRFPRLWAPDREQRDLRQLVLHRHKLVMIRSRVKNELQHLSLNKGMQRKRKLW